MTNVLVTQTTTSPHHQYCGRVLMVDKDIATLGVMEAILKMDQFQVVSKHSAEEGLAEMKVNEPFDFVISGFTLPGMNGLQFLHQVAGLYQNSVRILMSGGFADSAEVNRSLSEGSLSRYFSKPFCVSTFRENMKSDRAAITVEGIPLDYKFN
jgi:response regulator RpfG family c-di-GMP phosphodiesterase